MLFSVARDTPATWILSGLGLFVVRCTSKRCWEMMGLGVFHMLLVSTVVDKKF